MASGGVLSPYLAGVLRDQSGGWGLPLLSAASALFAASLVLGFAFRAEPLAGRPARGALGA